MNARGFYSPKVTPSFRMPFYNLSSLIPLTPAILSVTLLFSWDCVKLKNWKLALKQEESVDLTSQAIGSFPHGCSRAGKFQLSYSNDRKVKTEERRTTRNLPLQHVSIAAKKPCPYWALTTATCYYVTDIHAAGIWGGSTRRLVCWWGFLTCLWLVVVSGVDQFLWMGRLPMCLAWCYSLTWAGSGCRRDVRTGQAGERRPSSTADSLAKVELTKWGPGFAFLPPLFFFLLLHLLFLFYKLYQTL